MKVKYIISIKDPASSIFEVEIEWDGLHEEELDVSLPVWRPGRYLIFDFSSGVFNFTASGKDNESLKWKKIDKCTWRIYSNGSNKVSVSYRLYANEFELRTRGLNEEHAFVNGTAVLMYSEKYRTSPIEIILKPYNDWKVTTGLEQIGEDKFRFSASDYDCLADSPLEIGQQNEFEFTVEGVNHMISFTGDVTFESKLIDDLSKIIRENFAFWGYIPYEKYVFIVHCSEHGGGGTEHINSTVVGIRPDAFLKESSYKNFLRLISHEFFHTWNVKQLRPKGLTPIDYTKENYTEELWIAEGGTSYYDSLMLVRTGLLSSEEFLDEIDNLIMNDVSRPGNKVQSLAESSFDAWVKFWKFGPQRNELESDYYSKGANVSLLLDLEIRKRTNNSHSLDDVYKLMLNRFPLGKGYTNEDFINICEEISGTDFKSFFADYLYGTKMLEWERILSYAGLELNKIESPESLDYGISVDESNGNAVLNRVLEGSIAEKCGLKIGDEIVARDGKKVDIAVLSNKLESSNERVKLTVFRNGELMNFELFDRYYGLTKYKLEKTDRPDNLQISIYEDWLKVKW